MRPMRAPCRVLPMFPTVSPCSCCCCVHAPVLQGEQLLLSGGSDGYIIRWDVSSGDLGPALQRVPLLQPEEVMGEGEEWKKGGEEDDEHTDVESRTKGVEGSREGVEGWWGWWLKVDACLLAQHGTTRTGK